MEILRSSSEAAWKSCGRSSKAWPSRTPPRTPPSSLVAFLDLWVFRAVDRRSPRTRGTLWRGLAEADGVDGADEEGAPDEILDEEELGEEKTRSWGEAGGEERRALPDLRRRPLGLARVLKLREQMPQQAPHQ